MRQEKNKKAGINIAIAAIPSRPNWLSSYSYIYIYCMVSGAAAAMQWKNSYACRNIAAAAAAAIASQDALVWIVKIARHGYSSSSMYECI